MNSDDGFVYQKRSSRRRKGQQNVLTPDQRLETAKNVIYSFANSFKAILEEALSYKQLSPEYIICLGFGPVASSPKSTQQLALLQIIHQHPKLCKAKVEIYDPVFTNEDLNLLSDIGFTGIIEKKTSFTLEHDTLFYMPHCPRTLYNKLLSDNSTPDRLSKIMLLGNILQHYPNNDPKLESKNSCPYLWKLAEYFQFIAFPEVLEEYQIDPSSFNDMAIQWIPDARLKELATDCLGG